MSPKSPKNFVTITDYSPSPDKGAKKGIHVDIDHNNVIKLLLRVRNLY